MTKLAPAVSACLLALALTGCRGASVLNVTATEFTETDLVVTVEAGSRIDEVRLNGLPTRGFQESFISGPRENGKFVVRVALAKLKPGQITGSLVGVTGTPWPVVKPFEVQVPSNGAIRLVSASLPKDERLLHLDVEVPQFSTATAILDRSLTLHLNLEGSPGVRVEVAQTTVTLDDKGAGELKLPFGDVVGALDISPAAKGPMSLSKGNVVFAPVQRTIKVTDMTGKSTTLNAKIAHSEPEIAGSTALQLAAAYAPQLAARERSKDGGALLVSPHSLDTWGVLAGAGRLDHLSKIGVGEETLVDVDCGAYTNTATNVDTNLTVQGVDLEVTSFRAGHKAQVARLPSARAAGCDNVYSRDDRKKIYPSESQLKRWLSKG